MRTPSSWAAVLALLLCLTGLGCSRQQAAMSPVAENTSTLSLSEAPVPQEQAPVHIPGTGILSHQHEEHEVSRRISRLPSLRSPSLTKSQQAGPAPVVIPDVFTLSPHAHLLTLPSRNRMVPAAPQVDTRHTSVPDTIMYSPRPSQEQWEATRCV